MSNEDEKPEGGLKRRRQEEKTEVRQKTGREERVYSGKCMGVG